MTRRTITALTLIATLAVTLAADSALACGKRRSRSCSRSYPVRQPVVVKQVVTAPVVPAAPVVAEPQIPSVPAGATLTLPANFLGAAQGDVFLVFQNIKLPVTIVAWNNNGVTITLPPMAIKDPLQLRLDIVLPDGKLAHQQKIRVTAPASVILHPTAPVSPLPTS